MKLKNKKCLRRDRNLVVYFGKNSCTKIPCYFFADIELTNIRKRRKSERLKKS